MSETNELSLDELFDLVTEKIEKEETEVPVEEEVPESTVSVIQPGVTFDPQNYDYNAPAPSTVVVEEEPEEVEVELPQRNSSNQSGGSI